MILCGKSSCKHCEEIFDFKNKLHDHVRNKECQQSPTKSKPVNKTGLTPLSISETIFNNANTAIKKRRIESITRPAAISSSAPKSIMFHKPSLSTLTPAESITPKVTITAGLSLPSTPLPTYRAMSPSPPTYETVTKPYLTVADLYMRYASLNKPRRTTNLMTVLPIISMQNLYEKFHNKEKLIIPTSNKTLDSPTNQNATFDCQKSHFKCSDSTIKTTLSITKSNNQTFITQSLDYTKSIKHNALTNIRINDVRKYTISPIDLAVAVKTLTRFRTFDLLIKKITHQIIRNLDKI